MGKKSARKNAAAAAAQQDVAPVAVATTAAAAVAHQKPLPAQKRTELRQMVDALLKMAVIQTSVPADQWQQFVDMQTLLDRIRNIESELRWRPAGGRQQRTQNIAAFKQWSHDNGADFESVDIAEFSGFEMGLVATRPIAEGSLFVTVPQRMIMTVDNVRPTLRRLLRQMPMVDEMMNVRLAFSVLVERLDDQSFWRPYLNVLPERYSTVLSYTVNDMQELRGSSALPEALKQCRSIARQYAFFHKVLHQQEPEPDLDGDLVRLLRGRFTYELYCWAVSTVMTRQNLLPACLQTASVDDDDDETAVAVAPPSGPAVRPALIPLWDMANHCDGRVTNVFSVAEQRVEGGALRDFQKGEQIFIYYGDRRNRDFLVHNGFVYPDNRHDSVVVRLGLSAVDALHTERTLLLQRLQIGLHTELLVLPAPHHISGSMLAFVRVFNMNADQLGHWLAAERNVDDLRCLDCALDTELDRRTWTFLQVRFTLLLRAFVGTLADDEAALAEARAKGAVRMGFIRSMAVQFRVLEKRLLQAALEYVSQRTKQ